MQQIHPVVFEFEQLDPSLPRPPLAAIRALRVSGLHLRPAGWDVLPGDVRWGLVRLGTQPHVDPARVRTMLGKAPPREVQLVPPWSDPDSRVIPETLIQALGPQPRLTPGAWYQLSALERQVLATMAKNRHLLHRALTEIYKRHNWPSPVLEAWTGEVARTDVVLDPVMALRLREPAFLDGRALVLARVAGVRAARKSQELFDLHAHEPVGPVQVEGTIHFERGLARVAFQAHVSTADGSLFWAPSLLASTTAANALYDMVYDNADKRVLSLTPAGIREEPWLAAGAGVDNEATAMIQL